MAEVLTQEEINALLAQFSSGESEPQAKGSGAHAAQCRLYDFKRPNRFSREQLRTIHMLHETYARYLSTTLSAQLRTIVRVTLNDVQQRIYDEYLSTLKSPAVMFLFTPQPLGGQAVLEFSPYIMFVIIDRLMGGPGKVRGKVRELTEIEENLTRSMMIRAMDDLTAAWEPVVKLTPVIDRHESNPTFAQIVSPNDTVVLIAFEVRVGESTGSMSICIPHSTLQPVLQRLSTQHWYQKSGKVPQERAAGAVAASLERVSVPLRAVLGNATISIREMLELEVGDILRLNERTEGLLTVVVGDTPKFRGIPGLRGKNLAVQVVKRVDQDEE